MALPQYRPARLAFDGSRDEGSVCTLPELVQHNQRNNPDYPFAFQTRKAASEDYKALEYAKINHAQLGIGVHHCRAWFKHHAGIDTTPVPTRGAQEWPQKPRPVALLMESDVNYFVIFVSLLSLGIPTLLLSPKLSQQSIGALIEQTDAQRVITSSHMATKGEEAITGLASLQRTGVTVLSPTDINSFDVLDKVCVQDPDVLHIAEDGHYRDPYDRNVVIFHSSGTTGTPKAIYQSHAYLLKYGTCGEFDQSERSGLNLTTLPLYHGYGLIGPMLSLTIGKPVCWLPPMLVPTGESVYAALQILPVRSVMTVPALLQELASFDADKGLQALALLDFVASGGGPLKESLGERLSKAGVPILNSFGITEVGGLTVMYAPKDKHDWHYFRLRHDMNLKLLPSPSDPSKHQLTAVPPGWTAAYEARDVLERRPFSTELDFKGVSRNDGLIVLATGQKFIPSALEARVSNADDSISAAVVFGDERLEVGWLVEPAFQVPAEGMSTYKATVWRIIKHAQSEEANFAKLWTPDLIVIAPAGRSLPRSDKGSIMRLEAYATFQDDINEAYNRLEDGSCTQPLLPLNPERLRSELRTCIAMFISTPADLDGDRDLFELGLDSLLSLQLCRYLSARRPIDGVQISSSFVYNFPTINKLASAMSKPNAHLRLDSLLDSTQVERLVTRFSRLNSTETFRSRAVVLLTGSTGSLGSHALAVLTADSLVGCVFCVNRKHKGDPVQHQLRSLTEKGVHLSDEQLRKVRVLESDTSAPMLGLTQENYETLADQVTHVLHCAWPMDFKLETLSFNAQYQTVQNLLEFMSTSRGIQRHHSPRLLFVSSIAVVNQCACFHDGRMAPEEPVRWTDVTSDLGYGQAKLICELILRRAAEQGLPFDITVARVGQITGSSRTGRWNTSEHLPVLLQISNEIGYLPRLSGTFAWLPVEVTAQSLAEMLFASTKADAATYHVENPVRQAWSDITPVLLDELALPSGSLVEYEQWLLMMNERADKLRFTGAPHPVMHLTDFFTSYFRPSNIGAEVILDTAKARGVSRTLQNSKAVPVEVIRKYLKHFRDCGLLDRSS